MAEPLSIAASIIAVLQLSSQLVSLTHTFFAAEKDEQEAIHILRNELRDLEGLLWAFQNLLNDILAAAKDTRELEGWKKWLEECYTLLNNFITKLNQPASKLKQFANRIAWPLNKEKDISKLTEMIGRKKSSITLGLVINQTNTLSSIQENTVNLRDMQIDHLRNRILDWLTPVNVESNYEAAREKHHDGTGKWFLSGSNYLAWKEKAGTHIWLHGIPGCGKTVLSGSIIDDLQTSFQDVASIGFAYFYFSFTDPAKQTVTSMLSTIVAQLCKKLPTIPQAVDSIYTNSSSRPTQKTLLAILEALYKLFSHTYIIVDALDEVSMQERGELMEILRQVADPASANLSILITSRRETFIQEGLASLSMVQVPLATTVVDEDILHFVSEILVSDVKLKKWPARIKADIESALVYGADGMFRWVECQLDVLRGCRNANAVKKALASLPKTLDDTYARILSAIPEDDVDFVKRALVWLAFSLRVMSVEEIAEAIVVQPYNTSIDPDDRFIDPYEVLALCGSLVTTMDNKDPDDSEYVQLAHYSVKEYLMSDRLHLLPFSSAMRNADTYFTEVCLTYLGFDDFREVASHLKWEATHNRNATYPLLNYASLHWSKHILLAPERETRERFERFASDIFRDGDGRFDNWVDIFHTSSREFLFRHRHTDKPHTGSALYYFSLLGLETAVQLSLARGADVDAMGGEAATALGAAARTGNRSMVLLLLRNGADVNVQRYLPDYGTPPLLYFPTNALQAAIEGGHDGIARLLVEHGADVNARVSFL